MRDDTQWWDDDDDDETVAALQHVLAPLRERPRPWGDVLAQLRVAAPPRPVATLPRTAGLVAGLAAALLVGWLFGREGRPEPVVVERAPDVAAPQLEPAAPIVVRVPVPIEATPSARDDDDDDDEDDDSPASAATGGEQADARAAKKRPRRRSASATPQDLDVDCILDPTLAKCTGGTAADDELPTTLTRADWLAGLATMMPAAKACAAAHGMAPGDSVTIKLVVAGASGRVTDATGFTKHANGPLADCVARAGMKARFRRFRDAEAHAVLPVRIAGADEQRAATESSRANDMAPDDELPQVLTASDIKAAMAPVKASAKACGAKHEAPAGTIVKIKLRVEGATGRVTSPVAQSPHAGTELGRCVADAVAKAQFPRFRKAWLGVVYPFTM
ncbi:MAG TPA: hypothetical protein VFG69_13050 [Nannocystaceae bacterium]|nr:hypothetical protein [Nannocystaceae bacterium]